jgi:sugar lactone lactonase YvrE
VLRIASILAVGVCAAAIAATASRADHGKGHHGKGKGSQPFPAVIQLPTGFQPEGIEIGKGTTFYVGSVATGAIFRGDLRTGTGAILVPAAAGRSATGIEYDHKRLFVAGAATGAAYVYDARTGALLKTYQFASAPTFINDVVVTREAAYFTDSSKPLLYKVPIGPDGTLGAAQTISLSGDYVQLAGFNLNGIDATRNGKVLVAVQTANGRLYRIDPATGVAKTILLANGESVPNGDGILLDGKKLYVVQNQNNAIAVVRLTSDLTAGVVRRRITDPNFRVPTTIDDFGHWLYAVNARFGEPNPSSLAYQVVRVHK